VRRTDPTEVAQRALFDVFDPEAAEDTRLNAPPAGLPGVRRSADGGVGW
jgi:hypothetical protein